MKDPNVRVVNVFSGILNMKTTAVLSWAVGNYQRVPVVVLTKTDRMKDLIWETTREKFGVTQLAISTEERFLAEYKGGVKGLVVILTEFDRVRDRVPYLRLLSSGAISKLVVEDTTPTPEVYDVKRKYLKRSLL